MSVIDLVMLDLKQMNDDIHQKWVGVSNKPVVECANYLYKINKKTWTGYVIAPSWTDAD